jgi:hypothetical protein
MKVIPPPNYTQVPNYILDHLTEFTSQAELKVVLTVARQTFGWHKLRDTLSMSQLEERTGLARQSVMDGLTAALEHGWIERVKDGKSFSYAIVVREPDQSRNQTEPADGLESGLKPVQKVDRPLVQKVDTQKKESKKGLKKEKISGLQPPKPSLEPLASALAEVCHMDFKPNKGRLFREAKLLSDATPPATPDLLREHYNGRSDCFWRKSDWRGQKGQDPSPDAIRTTWGQWGRVAQPASRYSAALAGLEALSDD